MNIKPDQAWLEFSKERSRTLARDVWIPLRRTGSIASRGKYGHEGYINEDYAVSTAAAFTANRAEAEKLDWMQLGGDSPHRSIFYDGEYFEASAFHSATEDPIGISVPLPEMMAGF